MARRARPRPVAILTYHSLDESGSVLSTPPRLFAEHMRILSELDLNVVSLGETERTMTGNESCRPAVAITFDDGFRNVYEHGFPVLQRHRFPATIFLVTDYCGKSNSWPSQPPGILRQPLLDWQQVAEMNQAGVSFGSHTRTHPDLRTLPREQLEEELMDSQKAIEDVTGRRVDTFAYPFGAYDETVVGLAREHFRLACSTTLGFVRPESDPFALERIEMYYFQSPTLLRNLFSPVGGGYLRLRAYLRALRAKISRVRRPMVLTGGSP